MSPLQFQKQLRLQKARRLMLSEDLDAAEAGYRVGYDDASHFNREYKRHFGERRCATSNDCESSRRRNALVALLELPVRHAHLAVHRRRLRAEAQRLARGKPPSQVRYPDGFRRAAVALARLRLRPGGSVTRLARELGVSEPTLTKWLRPPAPPVLRPVAVTPPPTPERPPGPVLTTNGVRVTGLDRDALVAVLQALG